MEVEWVAAEVVADDEYADEPLGTKDKFWTRNSDGWPALFKFARSTESGTRGEDWAEWVVHHVGAALSAPTAQIQPASCDGRRGILSRSVVDSDAGERLVHGNSLLVEVDVAYDGSLKRENPRYTVSLVRQSLEGVAAPKEFRGPAGIDGFDVWTGYLVLDALTAGRDRHHENWGVVSGSEGRRLAASFDHGNALGFQEQADALGRLNQDRAMRERWSARGRSHHFAGRPDLVTVAHEALQLASAAARGFWRSQLLALAEPDLRDIVQAVPLDIMSDAAHTFVPELLLLNRERLLRDYPDQ